MYTTYFDTTKNVKHKTLICHNDRNIETLTAKYRDASLIHSVRLGNWQIRHKSAVVGSALIVLEGCRLRTDVQQIKR